MKKNESRISLRQGIYTQTSSILGVSIVTYPYTYAQLGFVLSTLLTIMMCALSAFTLYLLARCSKKTNICNLDELFTGVSGFFVSFCAAIVFYLGCILPLIFYLDISVDFFDSILTYFGMKSHKPAIAVATTIASGALCIIYMDISNLEIISIATLLSLLLFILYVIYDFLISIKFINFTSLKMFDLDFRSLNSISFIIFGFISHSSILPIVGCIETLDMSKNVIIISNIISTLVYIVIGFMGFCVFPHSDKNYLQNQGGNQNIKMLLKFFLATVNVLSFPLMMIPARRNVVSLINFIVPFEPSLGFEIFNIALNSFISLIVVVMMDETNFLDNMFFVVGSLTMFVIPIYLFNKIVKDVSKIERFLSMICLVVASFGIFMGLKGFYEIVVK